MKNKLIYLSVGLLAAAATFFFIKKKNDKKRAEAEAKAIEEAKIREQANSTPTTTSNGTFPAVANSSNSPLQSGEEKPSPNSGVSVPLDNAGFGFAPVTNESLRIDREQIVTTVDNGIYGGGGGYGTGDISYDKNKGYQDDILPAAMPYDMTS